MRIKLLIQNDPRYILSEYPQLEDNFQIDVRIGDITNLDDRTYYVHLRTVEDYRRFFELIPHDVEVSDNGKTFNILDAFWDWDYDDWD